MSKSTPYKNFGNLLSRSRIEAGIANQKELAQLINCTQQSVSRWERGITRPRESQIPIIASALKLIKAGEVYSDELLSAAGYNSDNNKKIITISFDQAFPLNALTWESFQNFCVDFLGDLYRAQGGIVHLNGVKGDKQYGFDINVILKNKNYNFDCKRVAAFSTSEVHTAIGENTSQADKKFLLLTCKASAKIRKEIKLHAPLWDIWDAEDITRKIRKDISKDEQIKLVDKYFPTQRFALLGELEAGPWQTPDDFFKPFAEINYPFSHNWNLVGRNDQINEVLNELTNNNIRISLLTGRGGVGKSRFLKALVEELQNKYKEITILCLSPAEILTKKHFEDIGKGKKILIVDDAHDATPENIERLIKYAADSANNTSLFFALRNYGKEVIKHQASLFFNSENILEVTLNPLNLEQTRELVKQVLEKFNGLIDDVEKIAQFTKDCTLATVIIAKAVAQKKIHFEFATNIEDFRNIFRRKYKEIILGEMGNENDKQKIKKILNVIALIQPFNEHDKSIAELVEEVEQVPVHDVNRLIQFLYQAGILIKRGEMFRIVPDMLADFIIDDNCRVKHNGSSTGYAERLLEKSGDKYLKPILTNLGKLDWQLMDGEPSKSCLLDEIWKKVSSSEHIDIVTTVAFYQPQKALAFAEHIMRDGKYYSGLPELIKYASYDLEYLENGCKLLWELNKREKIGEQFNPGHSVRVLSELCAVRPNKPRAYSEKVISFCIYLLDQNDAFNYLYSPFYVLKVILSTEGETREFDGLNVVISSYTVPLNFVLELRKKVIKKAISLLDHSNVNIAVSAARFLEYSIMYRRPMAEEERNKWTEEFINILEVIEKTIKGKNLHKLVLIQLSNSVSWHAKYGLSTAPQIAKRIINFLPNSLETKTTVCLIKGHPCWKSVLDLYEQELLNKESLKQLTVELIDKYTNGESLFNYVSSISTNIEENFARGETFQYPLYDNLIRSNINFAQATLSSLSKNYNSKTLSFAPVALAELLQKDSERGREIACQFFDSGLEQLQVVVAGGFNLYINIGQAFTPNDVEILKKLITSNNPRVVLNAAYMIRLICKKNPELAADLIELCNIGLSTEIAEQVLMLFCNDTIPFDSLLPDKVKFFLDKLILLPMLDNYWIEKFLAQASKSHAIVTLEFFIKRVDYSAINQAWGYRPCNYGSFNQVPLCFRESTEFKVLPEIMFTWWQESSQRGDYLFRENASHVFSTICGSFNSELVSFLNDKINNKSDVDFDIISKILSKADNNFVFRHRAFVVQYLEKAKQESNKDLYEFALNDLLNSAIGGIKSGVPGQPFPRDIQSKHLSEQAMQLIPKYSPAYLLYEQIKECAEANIERCNKEKEFFFDT